MRNYVIGTSDHTGRHLNMVQAENVHTALERAGVIDPGLVPRRDMTTHADVDYIYVEEPTGAVIESNKCKNEHAIPYPEIRTVGDLKAILASIPDNYALTLGSDSPDVSRITTLHMNPDRRELYVGVDITLNKLR